MAGRPIYRQSVALIEKMGGEAFVFEAIMSGETVTSIAAACDVSRGMLYEWLHKDAERWQRFLDAREVGAFALADDAKRIVDSATSESIGVDRERARVRQWLAERGNRTAFGKETGAQVHINLGDLHLTAVENRARIAPAARSQVEEGEYTVESVDAGEGHVRIEDLL